MRTTLEKITDLLNEAMRLDAGAMQSLVDARMQVNGALAGHPHILAVASPEGRECLGVLGLLNGIINGVLQETGRVAAVYDAGGRLLGFRPLCAEEFENV